MTTIAGIFDNNVMADQAVATLLTAGFVREDISLLMSDQTRHRLFSSTDDEGARAAKGAVAGGVLGGALGALIATLTAAGALITNGGALLVSGPIVAALSGVGAGVVAGGLAGALIQAGFASDDAARFEEEINRGKAIVLVHADDAQEASIARAALTTCGATTEAA